MEIKPYEKLLHREVQIHDVHEHYEKQLELLKSLTDYGTFLIAGTFHTSKKEMSEIIVLLVLLKQVVSMVDAIHVLASNACSEALLLQGRALFEASLYIDFILSGDSNNKAEHYYVSNLRNEVHWNKRTQENETEHQRFSDSLGDYSSVLENAVKKLGTQAAERITEIEGFLSKPPFDEINNTLLNARGSRPYEASWYKPFGVNSVRQMANTLSRLPEYELFYSPTSEVIHSSAYRKHIQFQGGKISIKQIRDISNLKTAIQFVAAITLRSYRQILMHYRPAQLSEFNSKYIEFWQEPFMNIPNISYGKTEGDVLL